MNRLERRRKKKEPPKKESPKEGSRLYQLLDKIKQKLLNNELHEAAELCLDATALAPLDAKPFHLYALVLLRQGRIKDAGKNILEAITRNDTDTQIHGDCGAIMNMLGRYEEAEAASRHAIELNPKNLIAIGNLATSLQMQGKLDESKSTYINALSLSPNNERIQLSYANLMLVTGELIDAIEVFSKILTTNPHNASAMAYLSIALQCIGEFTIGESHAQKALQLNKNDADAHYAMGLAHLNKRNLKGGEISFKTAINLRPPFPQCEGWLSEIYFYEGSHKKAKERAKKAYALSPNSGHALYLLTQSQSGKVTKKEEEKLYYLASNEKIGLDDRIFAFRAIGEIELKNNNFNQSLSAFKSAKQLQKQKFEINEISFDPKALENQMSEINHFLQTISTPKLIDRETTKVEPIIITGAPILGLEIIAKSIPGLYIGNLSIWRSLIKDNTNGIEKLSSSNIGKIRKILLNYFDIKGIQFTNPVLSSPEDIFYLGYIKLLFPEARFVHFRTKRVIKIMNSYIYDFSPVHPWASSFSTINTYYNLEDKILMHWKDEFNLEIFEFDLKQSIEDWDSIKPKIESILDVKVNQSPNKFLSKVLSSRLSNKIIELNSYIKS